MRTEGGHVVSGVESRRVDRYSFLVIALLIFLSAAISVGMVWAPTHQEKLRSIFDLGYMVGPTTQNLTQGHGLLVCYEQLRRVGDPLCFRSARMPVASNVLAAGMKLLGDNPKKVDVAKTLLFLAPLWISFFFVIRFVSKTRLAVTLCGLILFLPLLISNLLVIVTSMEVEEGYLYGLLTLALVLVLFPFRRSALWAICSAVLLGMVFLSKSSMLPAVAILLLATLLHLSSWKLRTVVVILVALAPLSWAVYQHHASGRYSLGTSFDGFNLHKGNNPDFQNRYPTSNARFDSFDSQLNGNTYYSDEWSFNDAHMAAGKSFALSHLGYTFVSLWKKCSYLLFSLNSYTATKMGGTSALVSFLGIVLFRVILWSALGLSIVTSLTNKWQLRSASLTYLLFVAAYSLPYLVGFGFMRHAVVLVYPSAVFCTFCVLHFVVGDRGKQVATLSHAQVAARS